ncbi:MAG: DNA-processing protein DprA [Mariprofundales bacterium]|nr:DNA-processing protein DprA [Mariprofundales bacterium]
MLGLVDPSAATLACLRLTLTPQIGAMIGHRLIDAAGSALELWQMDATAWRAIEGVGPKLARALCEAAAQDVTPILEECHRHNITIVGLEDVGYPAALAACEDAPLVLFMRGDPAALTHSRLLAVVGARRASREGMAIARRWSEAWSQQQVAIVSGMAQGIDSAAHGGSLKGSAPGIAVLGCGLLQANSVTQQRQIAALCDQNGEQGGGCVISEFSPQISARAEYFPRRNRIIAGLALATVVIEADLRSGSLITARRALGYGRGLFAVPGSVLHDGHRGCHHLIRQGEAELAESPQQVMDALGWQRSVVPSGSEHQAATTNPVEIAICQALRREILHIDALSEVCGLTVPKLSPALLALELQGVIERLPGSRYTLSHPS